MHAACHGPGARDAGRGATQRGQTVPAARCEAANLPVLVRSCQRPDAALASPEAGFTAAMLGMRLSRCLSLALPPAGVGVLDVYANGVRVSAWNAGALAQ